VRGRRLRRELALVDQRLHQGVIMSDPVILVVAEQISPGVADVAQRHLVA
jgi:hypothetical protein